jgi:K+-sensing histidine kinase KdpD
MQRLLAGRAFGFAVSLAIVSGITVFFRHARDVNQTTIALALLLAILAVSAVWGMAVSVFMSVAAVLAFNYFFLPTRRNIYDCRSAKLGGAVCISCHCHNGKPAFGADSQGS